MDVSLLCLFPDLALPDTFTDTIDEKDKFYADAQMLADDLAYNQTFTSVKPLMNFWAAFTPSREVRIEILVREDVLMCATQSGVGIGGKPKDTPFGLYRDGTELRAVYYERPEVATSACLSLGLQCDYPILLGKLISTFYAEGCSEGRPGNDPFYGGMLYTGRLSFVLNHAFR